MLKFTNVSFTYPQKTKKVLNNIGLEIPTGSLTLITGPSGSGKSTFLRSINGLVPHFTGGTISGEIQVCGQDPIKEGVEKLSSWVGFVFQEPEAQFIFDTVEDEIVFVLENNGLPKYEMENRLVEILGKLQIQHLRHRRINELSGGEQQKVAIASVLVMHPKVLALDEPTSQLDPFSADEILQLLIKLKTQLNLTILVSEHRLERLLPYVDSIINFQQEGRISFGKPQQVLETMAQVPPLIEISRRVGVSPLPLDLNSFPKDLFKSFAHSPWLTSNSSKIHKEVLLNITHLSTKIDDHEILHDINFAIHKGEILVILGLNGAGKTTLLRSILKIIPSSGEVWMDGRNLKDLPFSEIIQSVAYLPQNPNDLLFADSIIDELNITLKNFNLEVNALNAIEFLNQFGLSEKGDAYPRDLSVGERQRAALAAITVHDPKIIFLDEPTRGLDYNNKHALADLFHRWKEIGKSIVLVTHDVEFAAQLADRVIVLNRGSIHFDGLPRECFSKIHPFQTQTAQIFPRTGWITPNDIPFEQIERK